MISAISFLNFKIAQFKTGVLFETHWDCYEHCCKLSTAIKVQKKLGSGFGNTFHVIFKKKTVILRQNKFQKRANFQT